MDDPLFITDTRRYLYVGHNKDLVHPLASPIFASSSEKKICPLLIQVGDAERARDDGLYFVSQVLGDDEPVQTELHQDAVHVHHIFCSLDKFSDHCVERLSVFIRRHSGERRSPSLPKTAFRVMNEDGFPVHLLPDLDGMMLDSFELLKFHRVSK